MKALVYHGPHQMRWKDWPETQPGPGEVQVRVLAVGFCGSDLREYTGEEFAQACQWLIEGCFDADLLVTHTDPMHSGVDSFAYIAKNNAECIKFVLTQEAN